MWIWETDLILETHRQCERARTFMHHLFWQDLLYMKYCGSYSILISIPLVRKVCIVAIFKGQVMMSLLYQTCVRSSTKGLQGQASIDTPDWLSIYTQSTLNWRLNQYSIDILINTWSTPKQHLSQSTASWESTNFCRRHQVPTDTYESVNTRPTIDRVLIECWLDVNGLSIEGINWHSARTPSVVYTWFLCLNKLLNLDVTQMPVCY